jgi:hypothetical protein
MLSDKVVSWSSVIEEHNSPVVKGQLPLENEFPVLF